MSTPLSQHDWQILSEYLDGELTSAEQKKLEQRLQTQAELRAALAELRRSRAVLQQARRQRVPRNFTLTPDMVYRPSLWAGLFPVFRLSSALATLLVFLLFVLRLTPLAAPASAPALPQAAVAEERAAAGEAVATETPVIIFWGPYFNGKGGFGGGGGGVPPAAGALEVPGEAPPSETAEAAVESTPSAAAEALPAPRATAVAAPAATPRSSAETRSATDSNFILGLPAPGEEGKILEQPTPMPTLTPSVPIGSPQRAPGFNLTLLQIALAAVAVFSGIAAFYIQRRYQL